MKKTSRLTISAIAMIVSVSAWADANGHEYDQAEMPMMSECENNVMTKEKTTTGERHKQHHEKSTMGAGMHGMMTGHYQMSHHQQHHMSPMAGGKEGMMNPEMMQEHQQHMNNVEQSLANIEALLTRLVEQQKP